MCRSESRRKWNEKEKGGGWDEKSSRQKMTNGGRGDRRRVSWEAGKGDERIGVKRRENDAVEHVHPEALHDIDQYYLILLLTLNLGHSLLSA